MFTNFLYSKYEKSEAGIIVFNSSGKINYINTNCLNLFKYPHMSRPKTIFDLMEKTVVEPHKNRIKNTKGMNNKNVRGVCYDGSIIFLDITIISKNVILIKQSTLIEYKEFFKTSTSGMIILDKNNYILHTNQKFCSYLDYTVEEMINTNLVNYIIHGINHISKTEESPVIFVKKNNTVITLFTKVILDNENKYFLVENMSEKDIILEEIIKKNELLGELEVLTQTGYWEWCIDTNELTWSEGLKDIYEIDQVSYEKYLECNHQDDKEMINSVIQKCLTDGEKYSMIHRVVKNKSKQEVWLKAVGKIIINKGKRYLIGVAQDITEQYFIEQDYKMQKEIAEKNSKTKSAFVSSVSHELRTPLNGIIGMISLLKYTNLSENQMKYISVLDSSCGVLLSIINNILDFSRIESGKLTLDFRSFDIKNCIESVVFLFKPVALTKGLELNYNFDLLYDKITCDEVKIKQIVSNLISNSLKFTHTGSVNIDVSSNINNLKIKITDTGVGISEDFLKIISSPFTQADSSTTRKYGGSGLGLSIITSYIKLLKGTINISSEIEKGTEITVNIPISSNKPTRRILIVEDNYANRFILKEMITKISDYIVDVYENGEDLINSEQKDIPLLIFMDLHMPKMDGHKCTIKLRERGFSCPIIAVSANVMKSEKIKCIESGMDDFIAKPINIEDIENIFKKFKII